VRAGPDDADPALTWVELRGFEPLTPSMPWTSERPNAKLTVIF
jgi:hypothetical protein